MRAGGAGGAAGACASAETRAAVACARRWPRRAGARTAAYARRRHRAGAELDRSIATGAPPTAGEVACACIAQWRDRRNHVAIIPHRVSSSFVGTSLGLRKTKKRTSHVHTGGARPPV